MPHGCHQVCVSLLLSLLLLFPPSSCILHCPVKVKNTPYTRRDIAQMFHIIKITEITDQAARIVLYLPSKTLQKVKYNIKEDFASVIQCDSKNKEIYCTNKLPLRGVKFLSEGLQLVVKMQKGMLRICLTVGHLGPTCHLVQYPELNAGDS